MKPTDLPAIPVSKSDLIAKLAEIQRGTSPEELSRLFGGREYKIELRQGKKVYFWRLKILDASRSQDEYEIYMGEFENSQLVFGSLLPKG